MSLETFLRHMQWANEEVFARVSQLPDEALASYIVNPEWTVGEIVQHITRAAYLYALRMSVDSPEKLDGYLKVRQAYLDNEKPLKTAQDVSRALVELQESDSKLIAESVKDDALVYVMREDGVQSILKSMILAQSIHHATEHRAQLVDALDLKGFDSIHLDDYDLWQYNTFLNS